MILVLPVALALGLGLLLGGDVRRLADLRLRRLELFYAAFGLQVLAFPFWFLPWQTADLHASVLWLVSYALLIAAALVNRRVVGVPVVAVGMVANVVAVVANGGHMPALPEALADADKSYVVSNNSAALADPSLPWLVDRWAVPDWLPLGNIYSVGDVAIAAGVAVLVLAGMGVRLRRESTVNPAEARTAGDTAR